MTQTTAFVGGNQREKFFNHFIALNNKTRQSNRKVSDGPRRREEQLLIAWLENSKLLKPVQLSQIAANSIFSAERVAVKLELSEEYREHFVLLRGLLEFSRPKEITIAVRLSEKAFELQMATGQAAIVISYLDIISKSVLNEINFKKVLKTVLQFEQTVKQHQTRLYHSLKATRI